MKLTVQDLAMFLGCEAQCFWTEEDGSLTFDRIATITGVESYYDPKQENPIKVRAKMREGSRFVSGLAYDLHEVKPILRPISDMTEEEEEEIGMNKNYEFILTDSHPIELKWLIQHHFDVFGWIEEGLAISKV